MKYPLIAPSILSADFADMASAVGRIEKSGSDWIHMDIMDGQFVPPITFGSKMVSDIRAHTSLPLDVHLMTLNPERLVPVFADAGATGITFHSEACVHVHRVIQAIRERGLRPGLSVVPSTPVASIVEMLPFVDQVLVMTVNPGYGGQQMLPFCLQKVSMLRSLRTSMKLKFLISVDGGIGPDTIQAVAKVKPDVLVMGTAFFNAQDPADLVETIKSAFDAPLVC